MNNYFLYKLSVFYLFYTRKDYKCETHNLEIYQLYINYIFSLIYIHL